MTWPLAIGTVVGLIVCRWIGSVFYPAQFRKALAPWIMSAIAVLVAAAVGLSLGTGLVAAFLCFSFVLAVSMYRERPRTRSGQLQQASDEFTVFEAGFFPNGRTACHGVLQVSTTTINFCPSPNRPPVCELEPLTVGSTWHAVGRTGRWSEHKTLFGPRDVLEIWDDETLRLSMICRDARTKAKNINKLWTA